MKSIYRSSRYGFLEIEDGSQAYKTDIELATLCVNGVYGAAFIENDQKLHVIFNPERTGLYEISCAVALAGYNTNLHRANKTAYMVLPLYCLKVSVYYVNWNAFISSLIAGLNIKG